LVVGVVVVMTGVIIPALLVVLVVRNVNPTPEALVLTVEHLDRVTTLVLLFQVTVVLVVVVLVLWEATNLGTRALAVVTVRQVR
jgi:hypothetical protein